MRAAGDVGPYNVDVGFGLLKNKKRSDERFLSDIIIGSYTEYYYRYRYRILL